MRRVVNGLIIDRKRKEVLLLQKPRRRFWYAPGGKADPQESLGEAIAREIYEETGLTIIRPRLGAAMTMIHEKTRSNDATAFAEPALPDALRYEKEARADAADALAMVTFESWMLYTFVIDQYEGEAWETCAEGLLSWHPIEHMKHLPMPAGDRLVLMYLAQADDAQHTLTGKFRYTEEGELLSYHLDDPGYFKEQRLIEGETGY